MAAEAIQKKALELGYDVKVETRGSSGAKNVLTSEEIAEADGIIVAADTKVPMERFAGKRLVEVPVSDGISKPEQLMEKIVNKEAPIYHATGADTDTTSNNDSKGGVWHQLYKHLMNGVSHMLPFVVGGGILIAIAFLLDDYSIDPANFGTNTPVAAWFKTMGGYAFNFMLPVLAGYIAMSIADRPGIVVGFVGGYIASVGSTFADPAAKGTVPAGFIGAMLAGFVDDMMKAKEQELNEKESELNKREDLLFKKVDRVEEMLQNVAKTLAVNTNYATMVAAPVKKGRTIKFIQISQLEPGKILAVLVLEGNTIKNTIIENETELDSESCLKLNILLNTSVNGLTLEEINLSIISRMTAQAGEYGVLIRDILDAIAVTAGSEEDLQIYTSGATNIFKYPELSDNSKASELIYTLEEKKTLANLVNDSLETDGDGDIKVYIGEETPVASMKDCSVVTATYELSDGAKGTIGIIGPKRMDYEKVVETMKTIKTQLDDVFKD